MVGAKKQMLNKFSCCPKRDTKTLSWINGSVIEIRALHACNAFRSVGVNGSWREIILLAWFQYI